MHKNKWIGVLPTILRTENTTLPNLKSILIRYKIFKVYANEGMLSCSIMRIVEIQFRSVKCMAAFIPVQAMIRDYRHRILKV